MAEGFGQALLSAIGRNQDHIQGHIDVEYMVALCPYQILISNSCLKFKLIFPVSILHTRAWQGKTHHMSMSVTTSSSCFMSTFGKVAPQ